MLYIRGVVLDRLRAVRFRNGLPRDPVDSRLVVRRPQRRNQCGFGESVGGRQRRRPQTEARADPDAIDLSSLRIAVNGAEPIDHRDMTDFSAVGALQHASEHGVREIGA
ncbi:MAG: fatty-acyl-CoA synthase [Mycobacterium sp.]|nr:fatty-acyl-CoA synthase [Mycobacterium sp.]